jgi:hypothetical protein
LAWALPALALFHVVEGVEHQQGVGEALGGKRSQGRIVQQVDQRLNVVTTLHGTEQLDGFGGSQDEWASPFGYGEEAGFDIGRFINTGGMREEQFFRKSCSPAGGFLISSTRAATCSASRGLATTPSAARVLRRVYGMFQARLIPLWSFFGVRPSSRIVLVDTRRVPHYKF